MRVRIKLRSKEEVFVGVYGVDLGSFWCIKEGVEREEVLEVIKKLFK